jgi:uncharacterized protein YggE
MRFMFFLTVFAAVSIVPAGAQIPRDAERLGITVAGRATVRVPADGIRFDANVSGNLSDADEDSILAALRAGGIDSPQIVFSNVLSANGFAYVRGSLRHPTRDRVDAFGKLAASILAAHPGLRMQNIVAVPYLDDCAKAEEQARRQALDDARRRASAIAAIEGLTVGNLVSVTEIPAQACLPSEGRLVSQISQNGIERDPAVYVNMTENVTFAIRY